MELQINFSLIQPLCQISKKLYRKSTPCNNLSTALRQQNSQTDIRHVVQKSKINIINIHLPVMIFIRMHSQESQFHNKCLICSIKFLIYVQIASFVRAFGEQIQTCVQVQPNAGRKVQKVPFQPAKTCQNTYRINLQDVFNIKINTVPTGEFPCRNKSNGTRANYHMNARD